MNVTPFIMLVFDPNATVADPGIYKRRPSTLIFIIWPIFPTHCMKMKRNWAKKGVHAPVPPISAITPFKKYLHQHHYSKFAETACFQWGCFEISSLDFSFIPISVIAATPSRTVEMVHWKFYNLEINTPFTVHITHILNLQNSGLCPGLRGHDGLTSGLLPHIEWCTSIYYNYLGTEPNTNSSRALTRTVHTCFTRSRSILKVTWHKTYTMTVGKQHNETRSLGLELKYM